MVKVLSN
jgi:hypothetical protein